MCHVLHYSCNVNAAVADSLHCCMICGTVPSSVNALSDGSDVIAATGKARSPVVALPLYLRTLELHTHDRFTVRLCVSTMSWLFSSSHRKLIIDVPIRMGIRRWRNSMWIKRRILRWRHQLVCDLRWRYSLLIPGNVHWVTCKYKYKS